MDSANEALSAKGIVITDLESKVSEMKSSLEFAIADVEEKQTRLDELEQAKTTAEQQLEEVQDKLQALQDERDADDSTVLESVKAEVRWLVTPHAVRMLTVFQWNPVARVEGAPSI